MWSQPAFILVCETAGLYFLLSILVPLHSAYGGTVRKSLARMISGCGFTQLLSKASGLLRLLLFDHPEVETFDTSANADFRDLSHVYCQCLDNGWLAPWQKCGDLDDCPFKGNNMILGSEVCQTCLKLEECCTCQKPKPGVDLLTDPKHPLHRPLLVAPKRKFFIVTGATEGALITHPLARLMTSSPGWELINYYKEADAILFPGGADIDPKWYGDIKHPQTRSDELRDARWMSIYGHIKSNRFLKIGICGGGQFLNVVNGGKMWQDCDHHAIAGTHEAVYVAKNGDRLVFDVTSTHHQMMRPRAEWAEVWSYANRSSFRDTGVERHKEVNRIDGPDPEVVFYPNTNSLCFQPHPEYMNESCKELFWQCLSRAIGRWQNEGAS